MTWKIKKNLEYGFYEVVPKPSPEELQKYYAEKYYQEEKATYTHSYDPEEQLYFENKIREKYYVISKRSKERNLTLNSLLDIGCGEGFTLDFFHKQGWSVMGIDYSEYAVKKLNPHVKNYVIGGDIFESLNTLIEQTKKFDIIWLDNVLEHVAEPRELLNLCNRVASDNSILVIEVPNDFSSFQKALEESEKIDKEYWIAYPDHLNYFSRDSLIKLSETCAWNCYKTITDFPIEFQIANDNANYIKDRSKGKQAHRTRIFIDNFLPK